MTSRSLDSYGDRLWRRRKLVAAALAILAAASGQAQADTAEITAANAPMLATLPDGRRIGVVDGDSIAVDGVEWRLRGYDTPEIERAKCEAEQRLAVLARGHLEQLVRSAGTLALADSGERDRHKRPLGDLVIDGVNAGQRMIQGGYARPYNGGPRKGWCSRDSRDDLVPGPPPARQMVRKGS